MNERRSFLPTLLGCIVIGVLVFALVGTLMNFFSGQEEEAVETDEGIRYLQSLEQKDPSAIKLIRQEYYQAELNAQRNVLISQLTSGAMDPFTIIRDYCMMGDSRAVGFWYRDFLAKDRCIADGGHTIRDLAANIPKLVEMNPTQVFLCYGLNDTSIGYWDSAQEYANEYVQTVKEIQRQLPNATIVVSSILPAKDPAFEKSAKWRNIPEWSAVLEQACKDNGILFANCDQLAVDHPNLWDPDGIHFREEFYPYWASCLVATLLMEGAA